MSQGSQGSEVVDEVPVDPGAGRIYAEGWQSWSPATWHPVTGDGRRPGEDWEHLMRYRPDEVSGALSRLAGLVPLADGPPRSRPPVDQAS